MIFAWSWENYTISFAFSFPIIFFLFFRFFYTWDTHMKRGTYVANTIYNILLLEFYFIHPISTAEAPTAYSKYGPRSF